MLRRRLAAFALLATLGILGAGLTGCYHEPKRVARNAWEVDIDHFDRDVNHVCPTGVIRFDDDVAAHTVVICKEGAQ